MQTEFTLPTPSAAQREYFRLAQRRRRGNMNPTGHGRPLKDASDAVQVIVQAPAAPSAWVTGSSASEALERLLAK
jgi:hypothetical protein